MNDLADPAQNDSVSAPLTSFSLSGERYRRMKECYEAAKAALPKWSFTWEIIDRNEASNSPYGLQSYDDKPSGRLWIITPILVFSEEPLKGERIDPVKPAETTTD